MWWMAAIAGVQMLSGAKKEKKAAKQAREIGYLNANAQRMENAEEARRTRLQNQIRLGTSKAVAAGSGFSQKSPQGSQRQYITAMDVEQNMQERFAAQAGERKVQILERGGQLAYQQGSANATASTANAISTFGTMWQLGREQGWKLWG